MNPAPPIGDPTPLAIYTRWRSRPNPTASLNASLKASMKTSMKTSLKTSMKTSLNASTNHFRHHIQDLIPTDLSNDLLNNRFNEHFIGQFVEHIRQHSRLLTQPPFHVAPCLRTLYNSLFVSQRDVPAKILERCSQNVFILVSHSRFDTYRNPTLQSCLSPALDHMSTSWF